MTIKSREFFDACQAYRYAHITDNQSVVDAYEALIKYIDEIIENEKRESYNEGYIDGQEAAYHE